MSDQVTNITSSKCSTTIAPATIQNQACVLMFQQALTAVIMIAVQPPRLSLWLDCHEHKEDG